MAVDIGIDLGTASILVYVKGRGGQPYHPGPGQPDGRRNG